MDDSVDTVNAAAVVLAAAARSATGLRRHHQLDDDHHATVATKRWWSRLTAKLCFRPHGHPRRIADDAGGPTSSPHPAPAAHTAAAAYVHHAPQPVFAFVAPPSSPASSSMLAEVPSPPVLLLHGRAYSSPTSSGRVPSIFAVGPYAHGPQQVVTPPALSTFTTEPSTAPLTPPPESAYLLLACTNPSSPEVPFARFLASSSPAAAEQEQQHCVGEGSFHAYQLHPGSPIGSAPLVSPGSVCSTSSSSPRRLLFRVAAEQPPCRILGPEEIAAQKLRRLRARDEGSLLDGHIPMASDDGQGEATRCAASFEANEEGGGGARDGDEVAKSGEFMFGDMDGGGAAVDTGEAHNKWPPFFPMVEHARHDMSQIT